MPGGLVQWYDSITWGRWSARDFRHLSLVNRAKQCLLGDSYLWAEERSRRTGGTIFAQRRPAAQFPSKSRCNRDMKGAEQPSVIRMSYGPFRRQMIQQTSVQLAPWMISELKTSTRGAGHRFRSYESATRR